MSIFEDGTRMYVSSWEKIAKELEIDLPDCTLISEAPAVILLAMLERIKKLEERSVNWKPKK
jgi:hypothetical protein